MIWLLLAALALLAVAAPALAFGRCVGLLVSRLMKGPAR